VTRRQQEARGVAADKARGVDSVALFAAQHAIGLVLLLPAAMLSEGTKCSAVLVHSKAAARASTLSAVGFLAYNFLSLYVLLRVDAVSHAVCNTCRRAVTIIAAALIFHNVTSTASALGICLIIGGSAAYAAAAPKERAALKPRPPSEDGNALLDAAVTDTGSEGDTAFASEPSHP